MCLSSVWKSCKIQSASDYPRLSTECWCGWGRCVKGCKTTTSKNKQINTKERSYKTAIFSFTYFHFPGFTASCPQFDLRRVGQVVCSICWQAGANKTQVGAKKKNRPFVTNLYIFKLNFSEFVILCDVAHHWHGRGIILSLEQHCTSSITSRV